MNRKLLMQLTAPTVVTGSASAVAQTTAITLKRNEFAKEPGMLLCLLLRVDSLEPRLENSHLSGGNNLVHTCEYSICVAFLLVGACPQRLHRKRVHRTFE